MKFQGQEAGESSRGRAAKQVLDTGQDAWTIGDRARAGKEGGSMGEFP